MPAQKPVNVFFCHAPQDEELRQKLEDHLAPLVRGGYMTSWSSRSVGAGADWRAAIDEQMRRADLILLLVSADFLASDHLYDVELRRAVTRAQTGASVVKGILLRPCDWAQGALRDLVTLPSLKGGVVPVTEWPSVDAAFANVAAALAEPAGRIARNPWVAHSIPAPRG